jgi:hypothetical protein
VDETKERTWPGKLEFWLLFAAAPGSLFLALVTFLARRVGLAINLLNIAVAGVLIGVVFWLAFREKYRREEADRQKHWNGVNYSPQWRWAATAAFVGGIVICTLIDSPAKTTEQEKAKEEPGKAAKPVSEALTQTPYKKEPETLKTRGSEVINNPKISGGERPIVVKVDIKTPGPGQPPSIPVYIPDAQRGTTSTTEIKKQHENAKGGVFFVGPFELPLVLVLQLLGIGGSTQYTHVTLQTVSETLGGDLKPETRQAIVSELGKLLPEQIDLWAEQAKQIIDKASVDDARKAAAKSLVDEIRNEAKAKQNTYEEAALESIAKAIVTEAERGQLTSKVIPELFAKNGFPSPSRAMKDKIGDKLSQEKDWEQKLKPAWEEYVQLYFRG